MHVFQTYLKCGRWADIPSSSDPYLHQLADLLAEFYQCSRADTTRRKYAYAFDNFCKWCNNHFNVNPLPATDFYLSLYFIHLSKNHSSAAKVDEANYAISWAHKLSGFPDPCKSTLCISVNECPHRIVGHATINKKEPITSDMLNKIVIIYGHEYSRLSDIRICCMCLISYAGFLRFSELVHLRRSDIVINEISVNLFVQKSKTDRFRKGSNVLISRTYTSTCPVTMLERYLYMYKIDNNSNEFVFRSLSFCKKSQSFKLRGNNPLSYTRTREVLLSALESIGLDTSKFGLRSLRSGGAIAAASADITDRFFKKHGRWSSESAKDGYVTEDVHAKLSVYKNL